MGPTHQVQLVLADQSRHEYARLGSKVDKPKTKEPTAGEVVMF
jgi:hypothetical protein